MREGGKIILKYLIDLLTCTVLCSTIVLDKGKVVGQMQYKFTREELKHKSGRQFNDGDVIVCGNYFIWIKYGNFNTPSLLTRVSTRFDLRDIKLHKWPCYIKDFVSRLPKEVAHA